MDQPVQTEWAPKPLLPLPAGDLGHVHAPVTGSHLASRPAAELDCSHAQALLHNVHLVMPPSGAYVPVEQAAWDM